MAQISTGEGKTLITAILAIRFALEGSFVDVVTSSPVLAEANVEDVQEIFSFFELDVGNNCDLLCNQCEIERRKRYRCDVIYGDLSSFQRDILLSQFFGKDITKNRVPNAIIIDEVDSMLLDKGENILYLSHKIPEFDFLTLVFVEIWNVIHAPDVHFGDEDDVSNVFKYIKNRIDTNEIQVPKCIKLFVEGQLLTWIRSAFKAKSFVTRNDSYKVDDIGDGKGQQLIIMDKETGVEQVQMSWSDGLHQFLQLKHTLKMSPISLKAIFMSNIGYFNQYKGKLYGLTGTLGSKAECQLLNTVFGVN